MKSISKFFIAALSVACLTSLVFPSQANGMPEELQSAPASKTVTVTGKVTDPSGLPAMGVIVKIQGTQNGVSADLDGNYSITVPADATLEFYLMGFTTHVEAVAGRTRIDVTLTEDSTLLDEVLVVGYGTQQKQFVVGSVSQVTSKDLLKAPATNVQNMLAGRLAGMTTIQTTGIPGGDSASLLVRGMSTFNNASPLILVDGVEREMSYLNPNDIASVSILKDAATAAIYGVRAANGVVLVTTKTGAEGTSSISYDGSVSFDTNTCNPDLLDADEFVYWHNKAREMDGQKPYWTEERIQSLKDRGIYGETNWWNQIYNNFGFTQQHNITATGGNEKLRYYTSLGYMDQDGIMKNTSMERYNVRTNIDAKLADGLRYNLNLSASKSKRHWPGLSMMSGGSWQGEFSPLRQAMFACPIIAGTYNDLPLGYTDGSYTYTPVAALETGYQNEDRWMAEVRSSLDYEFSGVLQGLKATMFLAYNFDYTLDRNYLESYKLYSYNPNTDVITLETSQGIDENNFNKSHSMGLDLVLRPQVTYEREFGKHHVSGLFLFERNTYHGDTITGASQGYSEGSPIDISMGMSQSSTPVSGSNYSTGSASFAGRLNYAYDKKYIIEGTFREDASYKFAPENRWGFFPSVALGWVVSEEDFMKNLSWLNYLKLRTSAGVLGSDDTEAYLYTTSYASTSPTPTYVVEGSPTYAYYTLNYVYDNLTWSRTQTYDFGLEARALNNRLSIDFDWFYKYTTRILEYVDTGAYSPSLGGNYPSWLNSGEVDNRGFDLTTTWGDAFADGWSYTITGIMGWSRNRVLKMKLADDHPSYRASLGQPMGSIYGFKALGLFQTQEQLDNYPNAPSGSVKLGSIMYEDYNGDGKISSDYDNVKIGRSSTPEMTFSLNFEVAYKGLSLSMLLQGATLCNYSLMGWYANGNQDATVYTRAFYQGANTLSYLVKDAWTPENTDAHYPRLSASVNDNEGWISSFWVRDGSYLRVKNMQLAYKIPEKIFRATPIKSARVYLAGTNLLTFSAFKYIDPENPGINYGYYPQQRTCSLGVNVTF